MSVSKLACLQVSVSKLAYEILMDDSMHELADKFAELVDIARRSGYEPVSFSVGDAVKTKFGIPDFWYGIPIFVVLDGVLPGEIALNIK